MAGLHFDATYNNADVMRKVRECEKVFAELGNTAVIQGKRIDAAFEKISLKSLERAIEIMKNFPKEVQGISSFQKQIDGLEKHIERVNQRIASVGNGKLGSNFSDVSGNVNIGNVLKEQVYVGSQAVNTLSEKIIQQKILIKDIEHDVRTLGEAYRRAGEGTTKGNALFADFKSSKRALQEEKNTLFDLQTQQAQARLSVRKLKDEQSLYQKEAQKVVESNESMSVSFKKTLAAIGGVAALKQLGSAIIEARAEMQQLEKSFEVLLGSKAKSDVFVKEIKDYALISPLSTSDVSKAAQTLLGFGVASEKVIPTLKMLGDVSMGNSQRFSSLALAFAQVQAAGRLTGNDLLQLVNAGFNPLKIISEQTGKSMADLKKEMSDGSISADMVANAFKSATEQGGQFYGMIEKNADGIKNAQNVLQGAIQETLNKIGEQNERLIKGGYEAATYLVENYSEIGNCVSGLIGIYGTYRTALLINTVFELGSIKAVWAKVAATKAATIAQTTYNKVLMMNPYVMVGAALVSLGIAMWTFADNTSTAERAQKRFNERQEEAQKLEQEHKQKIDSLVESSHDSALSDLQRGQSLAELRKEYPKIFEQYDIETIKLADILKLKQQINEEDGRRKTEVENKNFADIEKEITYYETLLKSLSGQQGVDGYVKKLKDLRAERDILLQEKGKNISEQFISSLKGLDKSVFDRYIGELEKRIKGIGTSGKVKMKLPIDIKGTLSDEAIYDVKDIKTLIDTTKAAKKAKVSSTNSEKKAGTEWLSSYKKAYEDADKAYNDFLKSKQVMSETDRDKELKRLKELRDTAKTTYERKGGSVSSDNKSVKKEETAAEKLRKEQEKHNLLLDKQKREQERMQIDTQHELNQIEINGLAEGSEKVLKQRELNHRKELEAIKREAQDKKLKAIEDARSAFEADPANAKKTFNADKFVKSEPTKNLFASLDKTAEAKTKTENTKYNRGDDLKGLLDEYRDYTDKRLAIEQKFNADLAVLEEQRKAALISGDTKQVEQIDRAKAQVTKNKGMELMGLDYDKLKESPEYVRAFENLKETSSDTLNSLLAQFENAKQTAAQVLSPDQLCEYTTTIQEIMDELDSRNPFQALADRKKELAEAEKELAEAKRNLDTVNSGGKVANGVKYNEKTGKMDTIYLSGAQALEKYNKAQDKVTKSGAKVQKAEKDVEDVVGELSAAMKELGSTIGGQAGEIITLIGDIGAFAMASMSGIDIVSKKTTTAIQAVEKASVILAIISAAFQIAMKIASLFNNDEEYQKEIERLQGRIEQLQWELDNADAIRLQNNTFQALQKVKEVYAETTDEVLKLHSANDKYANGIYKMASKVIYNNEIMRKSAEKLATAYANIDYTADKALGTEKYSSAKEELKNIAQQQLLIQEQIRNEDAKKKTDHGKIQDWERQIQELGEKANSIINEIVEGIIGGSASDIATELGDAFIEAFQNGENAAEAWGDKVKDIVANVLKRMLVSKYLEEPLGEIFDKYKSKWYKDGEFAGIDAIMESMGGFANDLNAVGSEFQTIWDALPDNIKNMFTPDDKSTSQSSTKGAFETMSQDTGNELNGRFTALQVSNEEIKNSMLAMLTGVNLISTTTANNGITLMEIRNLAISSNSHLEDISKHTKTLMDVGSKLDKIEKNTSKL